VIVSIDKPSADKLCATGRFRDKLCPHGKWWPRSLHASLVDELTRANARVIVFDLLFDTPRDADDAVLSGAIARAGRVAIVEYLDREEYSLGTTKAWRETAIPPIQLIKDAALATAPFPLPRRPVRVNAYSPFPLHAGEIAVLPVVAFQIYALHAYAKLHELCPEGLVAPAPALQTDPADPRAFEQLVNALRKIATTDSETKRALLRCAHSLGAADPSSKRTIESLVDVYAHDGMRYLDLYGPPRSITTIEYADALTLLADARGRERFAGKSVFIGLSERLQPEQKDSYYTVFSREDGVDINGVELAATAFANLLEQRAVRWQYGPALAIVLAWGFALGIIARGLPTPRAAALIIALALVYSMIAYRQFSAYGAWMPIVVPLLLQAPAAFAAGALAQFRQLEREKDNIRRVMGQFLPEPIVDEFARDIARLPGDSHVMSGICLATDIAGYTTVAEPLQPSDLHSVMHAYFEEIGRPVKAHEGWVHQTVGDAMIAIWATPTGAAPLRAQACRAALEIVAAAEAFGRTGNHPPLPTRVGLASGDMALGNVGGMSHHEYRVFGDIVNTACRIQQELDKTLGTKVLASAEVYEGVEGVLGRRLGVFPVRGKSRPVTVYELIGVEPNVPDEQRWLCRSFEEAMHAWDAERRDQARDILLRIAERFPQDGPTRYYLQRLEGEHRAKAPLGTGL
jgi:adenylate cyclase